MTPIIAPQAPFEESATTEASRRCPLTGFLREIGVLFSGHVLEAFATGICVLTVQNTGPELLRIGPILSVCLFLCLFVTLFFRPLFRAGRWHYSSVFRKNHSKNGVPPGTRRRDGPFSMPPCRGRCTLLKWRLRRHLPPRPNWWRRSWRLAPVAPPAPAVSVSAAGNEVLTREP